MDSSLVAHLVEWEEDLKPFPIPLGSLAAEAVEELRDLFPHEIEEAEKFPQHQKAVLLAEFANWAAKNSDIGYGPKVVLFAWATQVDEVYSSWCGDGLLHLWAEGVGAVCAHDPFGELDSVLREAEADIQICTRPLWDGYRRQNWAQLIILSAAARRLYSGRELSPIATHRACNRLWKQLVQASA